VYGAEVRQIPTREINKTLSTEMDGLRRSARKSRMERRLLEHTNTTPTQQCYRQLDASRQKYRKKQEK